MVWISADPPSSSKRDSSTASVGPGDDMWNPTEDDRVWSRTSGSADTEPAYVPATINVTSNPRRAPAYPDRGVRRIPNPFSAARQVQLCPRFGNVPVAKPGRSGRAPSQLSSLTASRQL